MTRHRSNGSGSSPTTLGRRRFLAVGVGAGTVALAGCSNVVDFFGDLALSDLNVFNGTERRLTGHLTVTDPSDETVHDEEFALAPEQEGSGQGGNQSANGQSTDGQNSDEEQNFEPYENVLTDAGEYTVTVELADGETINGVGEADRTVEVTAPDEEHIVVFLGSEETAQPILIDVIESLSDLDDLEETSTER